MKTCYPHATYSYERLNFWSFAVAVKEILLARWLGARNLTFHFPVELAFVSCLNETVGGKYVRWVEWWAMKLGVQVVWENIVWLSEKDWSLKEKMMWDHIPFGVNLCMDTGHLMIGSVDPVAEIRSFIKKFGKRIKHLHIHENDLKHDLHLPPGEVLKPMFIEEITRGRTWMYEPKS